MCDELRFGGVSWYPHQLFLERSSLWLLYDNA
jgi:hypothetical protein